MIDETLLSSKESPQNVAPVPTEEAIDFLAKRIIAILNDLQPFDVKSYSLESYLYECLDTLSVAWQHYGYGYASEILSYTNRPFDPFPIIDDLQAFLGMRIQKLESHSPFVIFEDGPQITNGLLKVYHHLINEDVEYLKYDLF